MRWSDGREAVVYRPPFRVVIGWHTPPMAKMIEADAGYEPDGLSDLIIVDVHAGPPADGPQLPTAREVRWALEDEWIRIERERGMHRER